MWGKLSTSSFKDCECLYSYIVLFPLGFLLAITSTTYFGSYTQIY